MKYLLISITFLLISCGDSRLKIDDSNQTVSGGTNSKFEIIFKPFNQISNKCKDLYLVSDYNSIELYNQQVAICFFDNLSIIDFGELQDFGDQYCAIDDNYDQLTPEEQDQVNQVCEAI